MLTNKHCSASWNYFYENHKTSPNDLNQELISFIDKYSINPKDNKKFLDVGCGIGKEINFLDTLKFITYGYEISQSAIKLSNKYFNNLSDKIIQGDGYELPWEQDFFDTALCINSLDSMSWENANEMVPEIYRVLKNNSYLLIVVNDNEDIIKSSEFIESEIVDLVEKKLINKTFYNYLKISRLLKPLFKIIECEHIENNWHIVARKI